MTKWWHVSWKRVAVALAAIFGGLWLLVWVLQLASHQFEPWLIARDLRRENPQTSLTPIALPDRSLAALTGVRIEGCGLSIDTPWQQIDRQRIFKTVSVWNFKEGANISIMDRSDSHGMANKLLKTPEGERLFGEEALQSDSALMTAEMYATPDQVKWWRLPRQNARAMTLSGLKATCCHGFGTIYQISFGQIYGFQEGAPKEAPYKVALNLFDADDRRYEIWITGKPGQPIPLTQAQLNAMVASIEASPSR